MRQGQQNRRGRGRNPNNNNSNTGNRKSQNPLTRSFESAGPDVKLRGTPSHIAEKYITLARDAQSSGDPVLAENYLQHAEHYNRIILSYREQQVSQGGDPYSGGPMARTHSLAGPEGSDGDEFGDDEGSDDFSGQQPPAPGGVEGQPSQAFQQPPRSFDNPPQQRFDNRAPRHDNNRGDNRHNNSNNNNRSDNQRFDRNDRNDRPDRQDRGDRQDFRGDRNGNVGDNRGYRDNNNRRFDRPPQEGGQQGEGNTFRRRDRFAGPDGGNGFERDRDRDRGDPGPPPGFQPQPAPPPMPVAQPAPPPPLSAAPELEQPAFLRRPVRRPRREEPAEAPAPRTPAVDETE
jgi:Domain of unknown function (DUF4167)